jgi:hypothetical protein
MAELENIDGIEIDNEFKRDSDEPYAGPPGFKPVSIADVINLDTFKGVYFRKTSLTRKRWARRRGIQKTGDGSLMIPSAAVRVGTVKAKSLDNFVSDGGFDMWFKVQSKPEPLVKIIRSAGKKVLLSTRPYLQYYVLGDEILKEVAGWGTKESYFVGFQNDMDFLFVIGEEKAIRNLYELLPNEEDDSIRLYLS